MLFKISSDKVPDKNLPQLPASHPVGNQLTVLTTHLPMDSEQGKSKYTQQNKANKHMADSRVNKPTPCILTMTVLTIIVVSIILSFVYYLNAFYRTDCIGAVSVRQSDGRCYYKHRWGKCANESRCCEGEYAIGRHMCNGGQAICCLGTVDKCKGQHKRTNSKRAEDSLWSYSSLTSISSLIIARNVTEPVIEQAILYTVTALDDQEYYHEMSEKVSQQLSQATGQQWYCVVGQNSSYDMFLKPFTAYILIAIQELDVTLFSTNISYADMYAPKLESVDYYGPGSDEYPDVVAPPQPSQFHNNRLEMDTGPSIGIIRNELNDSLSEFTVKTIDYAFNACGGSDGQHRYTCVTYKIVGALNQQYVAYNRWNTNSAGNEGSTQLDDWQCIITTNTDSNQMVIGVDYVPGSLLDVVYANTHRVVVFKIQHVIQKQLTEWDVISGARKAIESNKIVILDQNLKQLESINPLNQMPSKRLPRLNLTTLAIKDIRQAVMTQTKYWSICKKLTTSQHSSSKHGNKHGQLQWSECVSGAQHMFSRAEPDINRDKHYIIVKIQDLIIILFQKVPDILVNTIHLRAGR